MPVVSAFVKNIRTRCTPATVVATVALSAALPVPSGGTPARTRFTSLEDAINRIVKRAAVLAAAACSLGALSMPVATTASAAPQATGTVYTVPNLNLCHGQMNTNWVGTRDVQLAVSADSPTNVSVTCTAQLYTYQSGPTGPSYTVTNGGSAQGDWIDDNGSYKYVCVSEMDVSLTSDQLTGNYAGCSIMY
jgi:hypothetical protein